MPEPASVDRASRWWQRWPLGPYAGPYLLLLGLLAVLLPPTGFAADTWLWVRWARFSHAHGLANVYALHGNNYNPLYHYVLWGFGQLAGSAANIQTYSPYLKLLTLPFDVGGALLAASLARSTRGRFLASLLLLFNLGYLYNTLIWGQVDAIYSALVLAAVLLALRGRVEWSAVLFVLGLSAKLQALIFLPPLLLLGAPHFWAAPRRLLGATLAAGLTLAVVLLPFAVGGARNYLDVIVGINRQAVGYYPFLSMRAYNWWYLTAAGDPLTRLDTDLWHGLSYRRWGMLLFAAAATAVLLPLLGQAWGALRRRAPVEAGLGLLSCALVPLVFCFFNTQMHERYWHSALLFAAAYAFHAGRYALLGLVSLAYLLNLDAVMRYLGLTAGLPEPLAAKLIAVLFAGAMAWGTRELYRRAARPRAERPGRLPAPGPAVDAGAGVALKP